MSRLLKYKKILVFIAPIFVALAVTAGAICLIYDTRHWNSVKFDTFYACYDFFLAYLFESIGIILFFIILLISTKGKNTAFKKIAAITSAIIVSAGVLAVIITLICNTIDIHKVLKDYELDCQLESKSKRLFNEAVDSLIVYPAKWYSDTNEPDPFVLKAARNGYPKAQNTIGCFYHNKALITLDTSSNYQDADTYFDRALFWFLKAAQNDYSVAQTNLGRIFMGDLKSNRHTDTAVAKNWLFKAIANGDINAFYYLGKIYSTENLRDAYVYWSKGAELGDEDCARELEKPEFAMGIPEDRPIVEAEPAEDATYDTGDIF